MISPSNLGQIEFLRPHPRILQLLIERSKNNSLSPFIEHRSSDSADGGFTWRDSYEESTLKISGFWSRLLAHKWVDKFYDIYPYSEVSAVEKTIYCTTEEQRDHVKNEGYKWVLNDLYSYFLNYMLSYQDFLQILKNRENEKTTTTNSNEKKTIIDNVPREIRGRTIGIPIGRRSSSMGSRHQGNITSYNCKEARISSVKICKNIVFY